MTRPCTICAHPKRGEIDAALMAGSAYRVIARQFAVSHDAIQRHASSHVAQTIAHSQEAREEAQALDVVRQLKTINATTVAILQEARKQRDPDTALKAIDRIHRQIELQAKLLGDLDDKPQVNILIAPEWLTMRATLLTALRPYAEARVAVATALLALERSQEGM
ncbi:MAG TPA: hypothetical protein VE338_00320 [Ktedonobacterales bacterium]|jgi:hypothetical protein|nr:hypothetical protein [Ktedonobacterales bacterium]